MWVRRRCGVDLGNNIEEAGDSNFLSETKCSSALRASDPDDRVDEPTGSRQDNQIARRPTVSLPHHAPQDHKDDEQEYHAQHPPHKPASNIREKRPRANVRTRNKNIRIHTSTAQATVTYS